jgi:hypothetical protein
MAQKRAEKIVAPLQKRADALQALHDFHFGGCSQVLPPTSNAAVLAQWEKAIAYGAWCTLRSLIVELRTGTLEQLDGPVKPR